MGELIISKSLEKRNKTSFVDGKDYHVYLGRSYFAVVDISDMDLIKQYTWGFLKVRTKIYARGKVNGKPIMMHRFILNILKKDVLTDHKDGNGLNNRRNNIRECTPSQNNMNRPKRPNSASQYKGVTWNNNIKKWASNIVINRKNTHLGYFDNEVDAAIAYDSKAMEMFGEFARLNF